MPKTFPYINSNII